MNNFKEQGEMRTYRGFGVRLGCAGPASGLRRNRLDNKDTVEICGGVCTVMLYTSLPV